LRQSDWGKRFAARGIDLRRGNGPSEYAFFKQSKAGGAELGRIEHQEPQLLEPQASHLAKQAEKRERVQSALGGRFLAERQLGFVAQP
jgi:hypothetical protein